MIDDATAKQMTIEEWIQNMPKISHQVLADNIRDGWKEPLTCDKCDVDFGSILCFERRGYFYLRARREWLKREDGKPMISEKNRICKKRFTEEI